MDEAGLGPNLGPLVITATVWRIPEDNAHFDFYSQLETVITQTFQKRDPRFHISDSKSVYSTQKGIAALERGVGAVLQLLDIELIDFNTLVENICNLRIHDEECPWLFHAPLVLPVKNDKSIDLPDNVQNLKRSCSRCGIELLGVHADLITEYRFNKLIDEWGNKSDVLTRISLQLLRSFWEPDSRESVYIVCDKHGSRNRYNHYLAEITDNNMIFRGTECRSHSEYRVGNTQIVFQAKAERIFPVAVASMFSKYLRELSMLQLNRYWQQHLPELKSTAGYPVDAKRYLSEIQQTAEKLDIPLLQIWRKR